MSLEGVARHPLADGRRQIAGLDWPVSGCLGQGSGPMNVREVYWSLPAGVESLWRWVTATRVTVGAGMALLLLMIIVLIIYGSQYPFDFTFAVPTTGEPPTEVKRGG